MQIAWKRAWGVALVVLGLVAALPAASRAGREDVDRVVATVDGEAILLSEVLQEMNLIRLQRNLGEIDEKAQRELYNSVLQSMIDDQLLLAQARAKNLEVSDQDLREAVDEAIRSIKERMGGEERYQEELQRQGITEAELRDMHREQKRKQILASRVMQSEVRKQVEITDDQVRAFYETQRDSIPHEMLQTQEKLRLGHILVLPQPDPKKVQAARAKIAEAQKRVAAGEDFGKVATQMSEWPTAKNGGYMGTFRYGDFESDAFDEAVSKLEPGKVSDVIETKFGLQIVKLESRKGDEMTARHIVVKLAPDEDAQVKAFEKAKSLRQRSLKGESFEALARAESDDPNSRDKGGILDQEWNREDLLPEFRTSLDSVAVGGVTSVVRSQTGFHLFKVISRTPARTASFDDLRDNLHRYLEQKELDKRYRVYVADLRKKFHVEIKA